MATKAAEETRRQAMLADYKQLGLGRNAAVIVARKFAHDHHDQTEIQSLAWWLRKQRRKLPALGKS